MAVDYDRENCSIDRFRNCIKSDHATDWEIAIKAGIPEEAVEPYGRYKAKIDVTKLAGARLTNGKVVLVTAISPTPAGRRQIDCNGRIWLMRCRS